MGAIFPRTPENTFTLRPAYLHAITCPVHSFRPDPSLIVCKSYASMCRSPPITAGQKISGMWHARGRKRFGTPNRGLDTNPGNHKIGRIYPISKFRDIPLVACCVGKTIALRSTSSPPRYPRVCVDRLSNRPGTTDAPAIFSTSARCPPKWCKLCPTVAN